jgi:hypothetical protein
MCSVSVVGGPLLYKPCCGPEAFKGLEQCEVSVSVYTHTPINSSQSRDYFQVFILVLLGRHLMLHILP